MDVTETSKWKASNRLVISKRFDSTAFKQVHGDLYDAFCTAKRDFRFQLKAR